jgi:hypothetical protein
MEIKINRKIFIINIYIYAYFLSIMYRNAKIILDDFFYAVLYVVAGTEF